MNFTDIKRHINWFLSYENLFVIFILGGELQAFPLFRPISNFIDFKAFILSLNILCSIYLFIIRHKPFKVHNKSFLWNILLFIGLVFLSNILSPNDLKSDRKIFEFSIISIWVFFSGLFIINDRVRMNRLLFMSVFWACILTFGAISQLLGGGVGERQLIGGYSEETNHLLGRFSGGGIIILLPFLFSKKTLWFKLFVLSLMIFLTIGLVSAGQRTPWIGLLFGMVYVPYLNAKLSKNGLKNFLKISLLPLMFIFIGVIYFFNFTERGAYIAYRFERASSNDRLIIYENTWDAIKNSPILGVGFGNFSRATEMEGIRHPHNMFFEIQLELGIIGLIVFLPLIFRFITTNNLHTKEDKLLYLSFKALYWYFFINAMISGDITDNRYFYVILVALLNIYYLNTSTIEQDLSPDKHT